jgi:hypothetical protein
MHDVSDFTCPNCKSRYKLVRVPEPGLSEPPVTLQVCKEPLTPTDGEYALKYFLIKATKRDGFDLQMKHRPPQGKGRRWRLIA